MSEAEQTLDPPSVCRHSGRTKDPKPMIFVHGVASRAAERYETAMATRDALFRRYVYDAVGLDRSIDVMNPYRGDRAAKFQAGAEGRRP